MNPEATTSPLRRIIWPLVTFLVVAGLVYLGYETWNYEPQADEADAIIATTPAKPALPLEALPALPEKIAEEAEEQSEEEPELARATAKQINDAIPIMKGSAGTAPPYKFRGSTANRVRALDCLAAAQLYEAGNDAKGQRAVAQVVLNRARHPAFPDSICGVVFQGSDRRTGCQFSFTCDGSLRRRYSAANWSSARKRAAAAIDGAVFAQVGTATHYHTDWVHPYWSAKLTKLAAVDTHLFFRWPGYWGTRKAFRRPGAGTEPVVAKLSFRPSHAAAAGVLPDENELPNAEAETAAGTAKGSAPNPRVGGNEIVYAKNGVHLVKLKRGQAASNMIAMGLSVCGGQSYCHVMAWFKSNAIPGKPPVGGRARSTLTFEYLRNRAAGQESIKFDCGLFKRPLQKQCL